MKKTYKYKKIPFQIIFIGIFLVLVVIMLFINKKYAPILTLKGSKTLTINYKEKYIDKGYTLTIDSKDKTSDVNISGKVNSNRLGKYVITYSYKRGIFRTSKKRVVYVKDLKKPVIILEGSKKTYICPRGDYKEDSFKAIDNYDGDITDKVKVTKNKSYYLYKVTDKSGNTSSVKRKIIKKDIIKPFISLNGDSVVNIVLGQSYEDPSFKARDNCDGDLTNKVEVDNNIDYSKVGKYKITYKVLDKNNNEAIAFREVNILNKLRCGVIYLTFDDGPRIGVTDRILDILKEEDVKATFFVTNSGSDELIKRMYEEGHSIGLHTASHQYQQIYSSPSAYFDDLKIVQDRVFNLTGYKSMIIRFPGGSGNTISRKSSVGIMSILTKEVLNRGFKYYDWNVLSGDSGDVNTKEGVYNNVISRVSHEKANVVLMHDIKSYTRDSLKNIITYLKCNGYTFGVLDDNTEMISQRVNN